MGPPPLRVEQLLVGERETTFLVCIHMQQLLKRQVPDYQSVSIMKVLYGSV